MPDTKKISFFHGSEENIQTNIESGVIDANDIIISTEDNILYVDDDLTTHTLGSAKSKEEYVVNLGTGGTVGGLSTGDTIPAGTSLDDLIKKIALKRVPATYTQPAVALRVSSGNNAGNYEVGTEITTTMTATFTKNDAGNLTRIAVNDGSADILEGTTSPLAVSNHTFTITEGTTSFRAVAEYGEGAIKNDNLGDASPSGHIAAGSITSSALSFVGKRNAFYGTGVGAEVPSITSAFVRGLSGKSLDPKAGTVLTINVATGQQYFVFAYPANLRDVNQVLYVEGNDPNMAANFTKTTIAVEGANGSTSADYKVYALSMASPAEANMTLKVTI